MATEGPARTGAFNPVPTSATIRDVALGIQVSGSHVIPDYEMLRRIGRGAYGEVWLTRNLTGSFVAVKIVARSAFDHDRPFEREFEGIKRFEPISRSDPSQVAILHVGRGEGFFYYVMELADGLENPRPEIRDPNEARSPNLETADPVRSSEFGLPSALGPRPPDFSYVPHTLREDVKRHGCLPVEQCVEIGVALTRGLAHLHKCGLVHRDVKPSNVIFVGGVPKLADIGLVTSVDATRSLVGTEGYLAPEGPGTPQADLYSLGKLLYEISTGRDRSEFPALPPDIATRPDRIALSELNAIIVHACAIDPRSRYDSALAMRSELELLRSGQSVRRKHRMRQGLGILGKAALALASVAALAVLVTLLGRVMAPAPANPDPYPEGRPSTDADARMLCDKAMKIIHIDDYAQAGEAYTNFQAAIKLDPKFARPYVGLLEMAIREPVPTLQTNSNAEFRRFADILDKLEPGLAASSVARSLISYDELDFPAALRYAREAVKANPNYELAHTHLGFILALWGRSREARAELKISQQLYPSKAIIHRMLGHSYYAERDFTNAVRCYRDALKLDSHHEEDFRFLGDALWAMGDYTNAIDSFEKAELVDSTNRVEITQKWEGFREDLRKGSVSGYWQEALKLAQNAPRADRAEIQMRLGNTDEALTLLEDSFKAHESACRTGLGGLLFSECWDGVRDDRRFKQLLEDIGYTKVMAPRR